MFNNKKIKELEGDIRTLYQLYESLERSIKSNEVQESFCINRNEINRQDEMNAYISQQPLGGILGGLAHVNKPCRKEPKFEEVSVKTVLSMVLKKLHLRIAFKPGRTVQEIPSKFTLVKRETKDV